MANLNENSTNYVHSYEPNTNDLTMAMEYEEDGKPVLRVNLGSVDTTSKARTKVSNSETYMFSNTTYDIQATEWDYSTANGATVVYNTTSGGTELTVAAQAGSEAIMETRRVVPYMPGRTSEMTIAVQFGPELEGVRRRIGAFDENDGIFFEQDGVDYYCVIRSSTSGAPVERRIHRDNWTDDHFDGTDSHGLVADPTKIQLMTIEWDWYGAGDVIFSFTMEGYKHTVHREHNANRIVGAWMRHPTNPVRIEITNTDGVGTHTMTKYGMSAGFEGHTTNIGRAGSITSPVGGMRLTAAGTYYPVVAIKLKDTRLKSVVIPTALSVASLDQSIVYWRLLSIPDDTYLTGGTWVDYSTDSYVQYNLTATGYTDGAIIQQGFASAASGLYRKLEEVALWQMKRNNMGTDSEVLLLACAGYSPNVDVFGLLEWIEAR